MAPSVAALPKQLLDQAQADGAVPDDNPPLKRRRLSIDDSNLTSSAVNGPDKYILDQDERQAISRVPRHPLGVRPLGNLYDARESNIRVKAGALAYLSDEILLQLLELLDSRELRLLGATGKALYAFTHFDELWRVLFIASPPREFTWRGSWRATYLSLSPTLAAAPPIDCSGLYSDALYRPFQCAHVPLNQTFTSIPTSNKIARLGDLSAESFTQDGWANLPFILTEPVRKWRVFREWSTAHLLEQYGQTAFRAEAVDWPLQTYVEYMHNCAHDESPLYLFDYAFVEKMGLRVPDEDSANLPKDIDAKTYDYMPPSTFNPDLFTHLGTQRPHHRWMILGPARSGSTFHKDPNATSAWNAVLSGAKYWIMFPAATPPPGVFVSADQAEVTSPLSIAEWLLSYHEAARRSPGCQEGICFAGEVLHVPSGWWHLVLNLEDSLALTQNFVPRAHLGRVLRFLRDKPEQVTGFGQHVVDPYALFVERLTDACGPELVEQGLEEARRLDGERGSGKKGLWDALVQSEASNASDNDTGAGFTFGFGLSQENDENED